MSAITAYFQSLTLLQAGVLASLIAGAAAGVGALPVFFVRSASTRVKDVLLGLAAGLMLGATFFSLVFPALETASGQVGSETLGTLVVAAWIMGGGVLLWVAHRLLPHEHLVKGRESADHSRIRGVWLFVIAIAVHNFPEGLAVGVGFGGGDVGNGLALTAAIFLQNLPEGFAVALAMLTLGYTTPSAVMIALATGVIETVGGFTGAGIVSLSAALLPAALALAAGAMLFVISHEVIPETHRNGHETAATFGVMVGFVMMMFLDVALA
ncbi:MAG: ZIP family metal transporter [Hyphomicrobiales bacterium]|nr:ZIP family metal transporter [Hyphomicrobiales bacterium]